MRNAAFLLMLSSVVPMTALAQQPAPDRAAVLGHRLFAQSCLVCHTKPTLTSGMYGPVLTQNAQGGKPEAIRAVIADGTPHMPGFRYTFTPEQIDALVAYVKTLPVPTPAAAAPAGKPGQGPVD